MKLHLAWCAAGVIAICWGAENRPVAKTALSAQTLQEIASVEAKINRIEGETLADEAPFSRSLPRDYSAR
jgi:hypothetical protein